MTAELFTRAENWSGGYYELAIRFNAYDGDQVVRAQELLRTSPGVEGWFVDRDLEPEHQLAVQSAPSDEDHNGLLYGTAMLPGGSRVVCQSFVLRLEDESSRWLYFCIPLGSLATADRRVESSSQAEPADTRSWREPLDSWLAEIARRIHAKLPFELGLIGWEVHDFPVPEATDEKRHCGVLTPKEQGGLLYVSATY